MVLPVDRWYEALHDRHAWRSYRDIPVEAEKLYRLREVCAELSGPGARVNISHENIEGVFRGFIASYGQVTGAPAYAAFIGDMRDPNVYEKVGYAGEGVILEAVALGLSTCWVGMTFHSGGVAENMKIDDHEKVLAISPIGYRTEEPTLDDRIMRVLSRHHKREPLDKLCSGLKEQACPLWAKDALEAAQLAPSAANRQPWRFLLADDSITITVDRYRDTHGISRRLDCGVAMMHVELGARHAGVKGRWEYLKAPDVARFNIDS
ncbi:MAG: nitroreductase family protein [Thermoleophilia bacterium]|nr:nitroreductase family protein [Thermoleophilia bacterium]